MNIELHILQNFAPSNLNRDDTNSPKECEFGGYRRARISSQCIKRAIRWDGTFQEALKDHLSMRSQKFPNQVYEELLKVGVEKKIARELAKGLEAIAKKSESGEKGEKDSYELDIFKTPQMVFYTKDEVIECAKQIKSLLDNGVKQKELLKKDSKGRFVNLSVFPIPHSADIALFGRMVTSAHFDNVKAACQVAHAISTSKVGVEFDFYTAMDDLKKPEDEAGAGMMGTVEYNSACFYRYANIDCKQLLINLGGENEQVLAKKTIEAFIRASVNAIPTGKQNSFAAQNPPSFVFAVVRDSGAWSLANAFTKPVWVGENGDLVEQSIEKLVEYWGKLSKVYGDKDIKAKLAFVLDANKLTGLDAVDTLEELIAKVNNTITAGC